MSVLVVDDRNEFRRFDSLVLVACLVVAMGLRLAVIWYQPDQLTVDRDVYLATATSVADGRGYSVANSSVPTAFRPPVYPLCLAMGLVAFSPAVVVAGVNLLSGVLTVWLTARLAMWLQLGRCWMIAALLVALDPLLLSYAAQPMTESLCTMLAVLWLCSISVWPRMFARRSLLRGMMIGLAFGLLVLSRPTFWPMAGLCGLGWLLRQCRRPDQHIEKTPASQAWTPIGSVMGTLVVVAPWLVRNWLVFSVPILTTTHGGYTLLLGNNPVFYDEVIRQPWGAVWPQASQQAWEADINSQMEHDLGPATTDVQRDAWQSRRAWSYITSEPGHFVEAALHRVRSLWKTVPQGEASGGANETAITIVGWYYVVILAASAWGACQVLRRSDFIKWQALYILILSVQLVHLFYWTNTRMRAPLTPAIALFAAAAIPSRHRAA